MADPASISAQQISAAVQASVEKALQGRSAVFSQTNHTIGFVAEPPHWLGIIYNNPQSHLPHEEAQQIGDAVAEASRSLQGMESHEQREGPAVTAHVVHGPNYVTIGFRLPGAPVEGLV
jgi:hypothetical protein